MQNQLGTYDFDASTGIATITMQMEGGVNKLNATYGEGWRSMIERLNQQEGLAGVIVASGHRDWCVGADLDMLQGSADPTALFERVMQINALHRALETLGKPVVAALTGSALGGGFELALACHHRIALADARIQLGLPEAMLGVIPGAGGTQRLPRLIGIQNAAQQIAQGQRTRATKALKAGLVDATADDVESLHAQAAAWIAANPKARQPWDQRGFRFPGGVQPLTLDAMNLYTAASALLYKKSAGAYSAPEVALQVIQEGCRLEFDRAVEREARAFARIATGQQAKDMIRTLWFHKNAADKHQDLPRMPEGTDPGITKITILGAGMMGGGLAFLAAKAGYQVVLKDIAEAPLTAARARLDKNLARMRHLDADARQAIADRVTTTTSYEAVQGTDLVIEAVVEKLEVKHAVIREVEPLLAEGAIFASNTSALPITDLAKASTHPDRFVGLHYFSPVEKMPLIEIIQGAETSEPTLARCLQFAKKTGKTPIVVNDGYGFYTSRLFSAYILEGVQLVAEGHDPRIVEWAARTAGMAVGPLQVFDEVTLTLGLKALVGAEAYGQAPPMSGAVALLRTMVDEHGRGGRAAGAGFYAYDDKGKRRGIWTGLDALTPEPPAETGIEVIRERIMAIQIAEVGRVLHDGILQRNRDAEVGAVFGLGFAPNTGGPLAFIDRRGTPEMVKTLLELAARHGDRYAPSPVLVRMAEEGRSFFSG